MSARPYGYAGVNGSDIYVIGRSEPAMRRDAEGITKALTSVPMTRRAYDACLAGMSRIAPPLALVEGVIDCRRPRGRRTGDDGAMDTTIALRVPRPVAALLRARAESEGRTPSDIVRDVLADHLK